MVTLFSYFCSSVYEVIQSHGGMLMHVEEKNKILNPSQMKGREKTKQQPRVPPHSCLVNFSSEASCLTDGFKSEVVFTTLR